MRTPSLIIFFLLAFFARAYDYWYEQPREVSSGFYEAGNTESKTVITSVFQLRAASKSDITPWGIVWNMTDSLSFTRARLVPPTSSLFDQEFGSHFGLVVERVDSGRVTVLYECEPGGRSDLNRGFNTLKLISDDPVGRTARLYAGHAELRQIMTVPMEGGKFAYWVGDGDRLQIKRLTCDFDTVPLPALSDIDIAEALSTVTDNVQGEWEFLDRDMRNTAVTLGGKYRIATRATPDGDYEIIYLGGAEVNSRIWAPGCIKGRLRPTNFQGDYDLLWYDSLGRRLEGEINATISAEGQLLQLNFPLLDATLRFRRVTRTK